MVDEDMYVRAVLPLRCFSHPGWAFGQCGALLGQGLVLTGSFWGGLRVLPTLLLARAPPVKDYHPPWTTAIHPALRIPKLLPLSPRVFCTPRSRCISSVSREPYLAPPSSPRPCRRATFLRGTDDPSWSPVQCPHRPWMSWPASLLHVGPS
ncbi:hypothetical protein FB45DRAFT_303230 [Roridomyces roridus]|uniref:Uncharacterized protein n=1 Tax=Roridomyces roridus TaxID=1738132 RepID=A0AAD7B7Z7_9AGAR|nr:hypothetical protein FB45DRAFT_303230 [Roridomyces roridus]